MHNETKKSVLIVTREHFKETLIKGIKEGREILSTEIPQIISSNSYDDYIYKISTRPQYDEVQKKKFLKRHCQWKEYYIEFLKQAFNNPESEYRKDFERSGSLVIITPATDSVKIYSEELEAKVNCLESFIGRADLIPIADNVKQEIMSSTLKRDSKNSSKNIFIVHGHETSLRAETESLLKDLGFNPVVLFKTPNCGDTIIEKLERESKDVVFAIILYTPCDHGGAISGKELQPRARQNVVFEHGLMCGILGRNRVVAIRNEEIEIPSDLSGILYIQYDQHGAWKYSVAKEMKAAGLPIDLNKIR